MCVCVCAEALRVQIQHRGQRSAASLQRSWHSAFILRFWSLQQTTWGAEFVPYKKPTSPQLSDIKALTSSSRCSVGGIFLGKSHRLKSVSSAELIPTLHQLTDYQSWTNALQLVLFKEKVARVHQYWLNYPRDNLSRRPFNLLFVPSLLEHKELPITCVNIDENVLWTKLFESFDISASKRSKCQKTNLDFRLNSVRPGRDTVWHIETEWQLRKTPAAVKKKKRNHNINNNNNRNNNFNCITNKNVCQEKNSASIWCFKTKMDEMQMYAWTKHISQRNK